MLFQAEPLYKLFTKMTHSIKRIATIHTQNSSHITQNLSQITQNLSHITQNLSHITQITHDT